SRRGLFGDSGEVPVEPYVEEYTKLAEAIDALGRQIVATTNPNDPSGTASGNTDGSGNAVIGVYQVSDGMEFRASRVVIEASGYTPSAPYTAVGFVGVYALSSVDGLTVAQATA